MITSIIIKQTMRNGNIDNYNKKQRNGYIDNYNTNNKKWKKIGTSMILTNNGYIDNYYNNSEKLSHR